MRGVANLRGDPKFAEIFEAIDTLLDFIPGEAGHLLKAEASLLHYLRTLRFAQTPERALFVRGVYDSARSDTVRRACIDCWRLWGDRAQFTYVRGRWNELAPECQRLVWLASYRLGDQGDGVRRQLGPNLEQSWRLGIERQQVLSYCAIYRGWCDDAYADA